jgi:NADH-quinone oxidoreductase subunit K
MYLIITQIGLFVALTGMAGVLANRKNILLSIISIEMMLFGVNLFLVSLSLLIDDITGEILTLFVLILAAAESALALALITVYFRLYGNILIR